MAKYAQVIRIHVKLSQLVVFLMIYKVTMPGSGEARRGGESLTKVTITDWQQNLELGLKDLN